MKKVLIISYYFPPAGGPGVQRVLKFVKYLRDYNWEPVVLTVDKGAFPNVDESLISEIPPEIKIIRTKTLNPFGIYAKFSGVKEHKAASVGLLTERKMSVREKISRWIRANVFIPDARIGWYPYAVRAGLRYIDAYRVDAIITSGPPHSVHLIGLKLHKKTNIPWIADFRDPWTDISYFNDLPMTRFVQRNHHRLERKVLTAASAVSTVSPSWKNIFQLKAGNHYEVIYNGYDESDFGNLKIKKRDKFIIAHIGNLYASRNPENFWEALRLLIFQHNMTGIEVRLIGNVDAAVRTAISKRSLDEFVSIIPYLPYKEALAHMGDSSLLLLIIEPWEAAGGMIPGKLYEYLASRRPVLGIGPANGDAANILYECNAGTMFDRENTHKIIGYIQHNYRMWKEKENVQLEHSPNVRLYSRKEQTCKLAELLNRSYEQTKKTTTTTA